MKKIVLLALGAIIVLAALPIIGNQFVEKNIDESVLELKSYGLGVEKSQTQSSYLNTKKHFEFLLKDADNFVAYLNKYANKQIPPYVNAALEGVLIGADVEYSNIPFTKAISVDIYPLSVSPTLAKSMQEKDLHFYEALKKFLQSKGVLYHMNYNVMSEDFDGYIKDIKENYTLEDATKISFILQGATFEGQGKLLAPTRLNSKIQKIDMKMKNDNATINFILSQLHGSSNFESQGTYLSSIDLANLDMLVDAPNDNIVLQASNFKVNIASNDQGKKAELNTKSTLKHLELQSQKITFDMKDISYDVAVNGLDKDILENIRILLNRANQQPSLALREDILNESIKLFSKGLELKVADLSFKKLLINKTQDLDGLSLKMDMHLKEDPNLASKLKLSPLLLAQNVDLDLKLKLSKSIYKNLTAGSRMAAGLQSYAKEEGDNMIFNVLFKDGKLTMNGKALQ